jgi:glycosyltransferase involved in cell wall biosynthesis
MQDLISIIIPIYNSEKFLAKCLDSVINQSYSNIEIICIDNNSTDNSFNILQDWAKKDSRIKVLSCEIKGAAATRNIGLEFALGKYLAFVDADDYVTNSYIEDMLKPMVNNNLALVVSRFYQISENYVNLNANTQPELDIFLSKNPTNKEIADIGIYLNNFPLMWNAVWVKMFDMSIIKQNNLRFSEHLKLTEDNIFMLEYLILCKDYGRFLIIDKNNYYYVESMNSLTRRKNSKGIDVGVVAYLNEIKFILESKGLFNQYKNLYYNHGLSELMYWRSIIHSTLIEKEIINLYKSIDEIVFVSDRVEELYKKARKYYHKRYWNYIKIKISSLIYN